MTKVFSSNLGYPRIGEQREWKKELEKYWSGKITEDELLKETKALRLQGLKKQQEKEIDLIPVGDFSLYDHVLDTSLMFGVVPTRFQNSGATSALETYFAIARGTKDAVASEMTKWFNTNYHYIVPEFDHVKPILTENKPLTFYKEAKEALGIEGKPVILGPITFLKLGKGYKDESFPKLLNTFLPLYIQVLQELKEAGVQWVQVDEPILGTNLTSSDLEQIKKAYETIAQAIPGINLIIQTYFESVDFYEDIVSLPVAGIGLDFVHGDALNALRQYGFPKDKVLAAGVIDGRNVWRQNLENKLGLLETIKQIVDKDRIIVQPSSSLLHVPVTKSSEKLLDPIIKDALSFADEKLEEVVALAKGLENGKASIVKELENSVQAIDTLNNSKYRKKTASQINPSELSADRALPFSQRISVQKEILQLPLLPTTTIGSLPQTTEVRKQRLKWRKGDITDREYEQYIEAETKKWIEIQEDIGIDVLVHGEFERTDMVEYFGEKLNGFQVTKFGWVQSYGSRCVKPPLIFGEVSFDEPMTVKESIYAQSLTDRRVKGMLTGPVTILNWSFVRDDISRYDVLNQIAVALRSEIEELEKNDIKIIQVDEPALREGLPLKRNKWNEYLDAAVYAFKLSTASVENSTQIHTHMCYSSFGDIFDAISGLDADVISIETSRSHGELISTFEDNTYDKEIGLGVYDIHSPRVPSKEEIKENINRALKTIPANQFWINPDCGLKTRQEAETIAALKLMVEAAIEVRNEQFAAVQDN
ncbi:5-methyltetrahydropteroyltriglutamate--homocysteine S-methyltransferase [Lederbergia lenta]|uniref:5-methyltetrahydropteroyltriglutamate--homocysteine methyltransferase n=1 Tax=Lederbergia lenta TaxID=1467 RepID=A0A2X4W0B3_LEDLE|nr:5-methyltetrahydropteroyltriglutamate--homocysteine S-methyltransferase [Lederbergia lenta]MCM3111600.1 5-methyltetrahydropteroyltriglutamate--homocysteine S-methyltransferase [Lederbergia lenta]MEC2325012.1 5-methyltetrahydropteroyltriglutamate--homocysteine S-methyltransferase [Lederbergia lenta]SQI56493.1 5-methyltetrahydropteroyltriglutamate--homocysteine S-methyltransferase [Lederbergia lenta]